MTKRERKKNEEKKNTHTQKTNILQIHNVYMSEYYGTRVEVTSQYILGTRKTDQYEGQEYFPTSVTNSGMYELTKEDTSCCTEM